MGEEITLIIIFFSGINDTNFKVLMIVLIYSRLGMNWKVDRLECFDMIGVLLLKIFYRGLIQLRYEVSIHTFKAQL